MDKYKVRKECVYVHCKAGKGRSAVVTVCYLMKVTLCSKLSFLTSMSGGKCHLVLCNLAFCWGLMM